jgi:hypothetical protein
MAEDGVPSTILTGILVSTLSISSVKSARTMMLQSEICKWSCRNEIVALTVCPYDGDKNCSIGDEGERCGWKVKKME